MRTSHTKGWLLSAALLAAFAFSGAAVAGGFDLRVNDVSGLDEPWPMVGGLPFPEGTLHDPSEIRIVDADGREMPAQIDVAATWRDGSIRWALAGFTATPQGEYRVEFGPGVTRSAPENPLAVEEGAGGALTIDTGAAVYEFLPDRLLPESARMGDTVFLSNAGDGAYLVDNHGRLSRAAGESAEIETEILKQGPVRTVVRREGWYVTGDGEQVARARMWFYFAAGTPFARMTHSIVFTEDTSDLWVRDYGLELRTPESPEEAVFALSEATEADRFIAGGAPAEQRRMIADMFSAGLVEREQTLFTAVPNGDEVYMLQENYPHALERDFRGVVARAPSALLPGKEGAHLGSLWVHHWLRETEVVGDWGEARHGESALMVVMPQLAQRFPKEIAIGPEGARVAFWSGRSGRELDFRAVTLVNEYWKRWADNAVHAFGMPTSERGPAVGTRVASQPSNAQGAARTHDVWLLPRAGGMDGARLKARGLAAAHPPLLQADPAWLGDAKAVGWPLHPKDPERFPDVEERLEEHWDNTLGGRYGHVEVRRAGFLMWGKNATLGTGPRWFRLSRSAGRYGFDRSAWQLYLRSGERRYFDYARHATRFAGDLHLHHWTVGDRFRGGFVSQTVNLPFYWHGRSVLSCRSTFWTFGWLMDYYQTGDEYAHELTQMVADAYREQADPHRAPPGPAFNNVFNLGMLYQHTGDETIRELARMAAHSLIDLDNPVGLNDDVRYSVFYKISTEWLLPLYFYYNATGDEAAREAILRAVDRKFRFNHEDWTGTPDGRGPSSDQTFRLFIFAEAYRWTGNPAYLPLLKHMTMAYPHGGIKGHNYLFGAPVALHAIGRAEEPIGPFPVVAATRDPNHRLRMDFEFIGADALPPVRIRKEADESVTLSVYVRMLNDMDEDTVPEAVVARRDPDGDGARLGNVRIERDRSFKTKNPERRDLRRWHFYLTIPEDAATGVYTIEFPNAATIAVLETDAPEIALEGD